MKSKNDLTLENVHITFELEKRDLLMESDGGNE